MNEQQLRSVIARQMPRVRADLERLVRVPSVAFPGFDHDQVERSAEAVARLLREEGLSDVRVVRDGGQPAVIAFRPAPSNAPTVMLYAHHDVQPAGDRRQWTNDPFEPVERDGRLFGRGAADDKAGIMVHVAALRALGEDLGVGVVVLVEGEEEIGSASLERLLRRHCAGTAIDVIVLADSANWEVGTPALTTGLRGSISAMIEVRTLDHAIHSGFFGGPIPDALTALCRLLATFHDQDGNVAVDGLTVAETASLDYPDERLRAESGLLDGVDLIGTGTLVERLWAKPAVSVLGIDAPSAADAANALVPSARAKIGVRIAPGDDAKRAVEAVLDHCRRHTPWGASVTVTIDQVGEACLIDTSAPAFDSARKALSAAWDGRPSADIGIGGSIPFIATFQELYPAAAILVTGVEDPDARAHGPNESLHLGEFERACLAEALLLADLAPNRQPSCPGVERDVD